MGFRTVETKPICMSIVTLFSVFRWFVLISFCHLPTSKFNVSGYDCITTEAPSCDDEHSTRRNYHVLLMSRTFRGIILLVLCNRNRGSTATGHAAMTHHNIHHGQNFKPH